MPVKKTKGGYKWGSKGKVYPTRKQALEHGKAIKASEARKIRRGNC